MSTDTAFALGVLALVGLGGTRLRGYLLNAKARRSGLSIKRSRTGVPTPL
jgi:hypothetical protein